MMPFPITSVKLIGAPECKLYALNIVFSEVNTCWIRSFQNDKTAHSPESQPEKPIKQI